MINVAKLDQELRTAGVPIHGCDSEGEVSFADEATTAQRKKAAKIVADHDPTDTREQRHQKNGISPLLAAVILLLGDSNPPPEARQIVQAEAARIRSLW